MSDLLDMEKINSLPQPLWTWDNWPIYDIDVETGLYRIDVCGLLEARKFGEVIYIRDANGEKHDPEDFYLEEQRI